MAVNESSRRYYHPLYDALLSTPGGAVGLTAVDRLLTWGSTNSLWIFPMATSCCGIELMSAAASRVDLDRMGSIVRATPRQADVMVVAGTITVKMAPRVKRLWDQMPEPKWCMAMGACAISGDFYRDLYPVVPGIDTFVPVDVYVPGCPPNPEAVMHGLLRLKEKVELVRAGKWAGQGEHPAIAGLEKKMSRPAIGRLDDPDRQPRISEEQVAAALDMPRDAEPGTASAQGAWASEGDSLASGGASLGPSDRDVTGLFRDRFGVVEFPDGAPPLVEARFQKDLARALKEMGFRFLVFMAASHWPAKVGKDGGSTQEESFEVAYGLRTVGPSSRLATWRVKVPAGAAVPSLSSLFAGAIWQEREQFDLTGVVFDGNPDLRRILLPDGWQGHPLRRDYASDAACPPWR
ncbi:MAG: NADH-quinone oxidoreductase subunit NuoB [Deltaproteobacteria bacterium]|nr:NADH-quinone oxidoreductase subunit NuoB [Deltaproteobacteria bacterium]